MRLGGSWHFVNPVEGATLYDRAMGQCIHYDGVWHAVTLPAAATGGPTIDTEARALLAQVIDALAELGLVARQPV